MQNILQCICQESNQQSYKVLFNMSPSSLYNTLKSASEAICRFTYGSGKSPCTKIKSEFTRTLNNYS